MPNSMKLQHCHNICCVWGEGFGYYQMTQMFFFCQLRRISFENFENSHPFCLTCVVDDLPTAGNLKHCVRLCKKLCSSSNQCTVVFSSNDFAPYLSMPQSKLYELYTPNKMHAIHARYFKATVNFKGDNSIFLFSCGWNVGQSW